MNMKVNKAGGATINIAARGSGTDVDPYTSHMLVVDSVNPILSVPFLKDRGSFTIASTMTPDTRFFDASPGHGIQVGESIELAEVSSGIFMQAIVLAVVIDTIEIDTLINFAYEPEDIGVRSTKNMLVDGSTTPQVFSILPLTSQKGHIVRIVWDIRSSADMDFSGFGGVPALTRGCIVRIKNQDGTFKNLMTFKTNGDIIEHCFDHEFLQPKGGNTIKGFTARLTWGGPDKHGVVIPLDGSKAEELQLVVQDDLTNVVNTKFTILAQGHLI